MSARRRGDNADFLEERRLMELANFDDDPQCIGTITASTTNQELMQIERQVESINRDLAAFGIAWRFTALVRGDRVYVEPIPRAACP